MLGIDPPEAGAEGPHDQRADLTGNLDAGRASAHDADRQPAGPLLGIVGQLCHLERLQQPPPVPERIVQRLHAGRVLRQLVVAEVRERRPPRQSGCRTGSRSDAVRADRLHDAPWQVEAGDLGEQHRGVLLVAKICRNEGATSPSETMPVATW